MRNFNFIPPSISKAHHPARNGRNRCGSPIIRERFDAIAPDIADNLRRLDEKLTKKYGLTAAKHIQDMRKAIARRGYDGLMKLIKTGVLPASIIGFVVVGLT